jgi:cobalt-zinc-cadmium efflux system membrane fusion protein
MIRSIRDYPKRRVAALAAALLALAAWSWIARPGTAGAASATPSPLQESAATSVQLTDAQWATLDIRATTGASFPTLAVADAVVAVDDRATVPVFSPATGRVAAVDVEAGQFVRRGQALAYIEGVETAQAAADLAAAQAQSRTAERQLALSREVATRQQGLVDAGGGSLKDWHQSQSDLIAAEGAARTADAALVAARIKTASVDAVASGSKGGADPARLAAPIAGLVIQRQVAAGQFVSSLAAGGQSPLFTISDLRHVWVVASLGERDGARLSVGQPVEISLLAPASQPVRSVISWIAPVVDPQTRRIQFRAELANPDLAFKPQMTARMRVLDRQSAPAVAVPSVAVIHDGDEAHCYVASGPRTLTLRRLTIGRTENGLTEVLAGLRPGDRVVARGAIFVDALAEGSAS